MRKSRFHPAQPKVFNDKAVVTAWTLGPKGQEACHGYFRITKQWVTGGNRFYECRYCDSMTGTITDKVSPVQFAHQNLRDHGVRVRRDGTIRQTHYRVFVRNAQPVWV